MAKIKSDDGKPKKSKSKQASGPATDRYSTALRDAGAKAAELAQNPVARSMLAAGLVTAAAALTANKTVRESAKRAGRDAVDGAEAAADNASKVGAAIVTAATDAVRRMMAAGKDATRADAAESEDAASPPPTPTPRAPAAKKAAKPRTAKPKTTKAAKSKAKAADAAGPAGGAAGDAKPKAKKGKGASASAKRATGSKPK